MGNDWTQTTLDKVSIDVSYGYTESASEEKVGPKFLRITDIQKGVVNWKTVPYCPITSQNHKKYKLFNGDIVVARTGNSTGENYLFNSLKDAVYASYLIRFRINSEIADPQYIWYTMRSPNWWGFVNSSKTGSAQAGANAKVLGSFPIELPSLTEQHAIAHILGSLDDKIELNRKINDTLEAMAQALFKSWFVDFDPVIDNALAAGNEIPDVFKEKAAVRKALGDDRKPLPEDIRNLFPNEFEWTDEMGWIPKGWECKPWRKIAKLEYGKSLKGYRDGEGTIPVFGTNGAIGLTDKALCQNDGIVIGRKGAYRGVHYSSVPFYVIDTAFYLAPITRVSNKWAYYEILRFDINGMDSGSAIPSTSRDDFYSLWSTLPSPIVQTEFDRIVSSFYRKKAANNTVNASLTKLRDTLLPKLLSGELRIPDAEKMM